MPRGSLGVSVHFRFKNQMRLKKIEGTFQGGFGDGKPERVIEDFEPDENGKPVCGAN